MKVGIIGAGITGLTAAYELAKKGHRVEVFEASERVGGLASGFKDERWEWHLERFYHHWFASDQAVLDLIKELGLSEKVFFPRPITSIWYQGGIYPFDNPLAVLRFPHLSLAGKIRFGLVGLYLRLSSRWEPLEKYTAHE
ncbi:MAG TPA: FAD-dependent oxidoreductase, partial [Chloroflexi bacterium]|nr:FAD-dependent oxidoreductase [Chloroflexota bacterium]